MTQLISFYTKLFFGRNYEELNLSSDVVLMDVVENKIYSGKEVVIERLKCYMRSLDDCKGDISDYYMKDNTKLSIKIHWPNHQKDIIEYHLKYKDDMITNICVCMGTERDYYDSDSDFDFDSASDAD